MTDRYAVIGNPIAQSRSPDIHHAFARATGQDIEYTRIEAALGGFDAGLDAFRRLGGRGLNVTAPFKLDAFARATSIDERARRAGAANALKFEGDAILADNFDGIGLVRDIAVNQGARLAGARILLLGAGGATRGALLPLLDQGPAVLVVANRDVAKAAEVVLGTPAVIATYSDLELVASFDVVLNATSASLFGACPSVPRQSFAAGCLAYDLTYGKGLTPFLRLAREAGAGRVVDGVGMLVEQAAEAFLWWRGVRPATAPVIAAITVPLA